MGRREQGFTLIEILVVITIIAALVGMVTLVIPQGTAAKNKVECMNNLRQIGGLLKTMDAGSKMKRYNGAAFLLQVAGDVNNSDLEVFICPGEEDNMDDRRPDAGTQEFIDMYRKELDLAGKKIEHRFTSFAGPNWTDFPPQKAGAGSQAARLWGCDKCRNGAAHHAGISLLYNTGKTKFMDYADIEGMGEDGVIVVGKNSANPLLEKMTFFPNQ